MPFNQPGFSNYGQPFAFNTPFQFNGYPEVIGEGNVTSVMSPDGSMQLLFLPTTQWWRPYPCNINTANMNNPNWNPTGAWFIRSVFSPMQPMSCQIQPLQAPSGIAFPRTYNSDCCVSQPTCLPPNFELKFHNDICTSTSDIHYFYPSLRPCDWLKKPKGCASVQVEVPMVTNSICHYDVICTKPCNCCTPMDETEITTKAKCSCKKKSDTSFSEMSCETDKSDTEECSCHKGQVKKSRKEKKKSNPKKKTSSKVICECKELNEKETSEKCVSTYADQACGCVEDKGRETQTAAAACGKGNETQTAPYGKGQEAATGCEHIPVRKVRSGCIKKKQIKAELWIPKTPSSKKSMKAKSSGNFAGVCESGCCSGTCSCHSDTE